MPSFWPVMLQKVISSVPGWRRCCNASTRVVGRIVVVIDVRHAESGLDLHQPVFHIVGALGGSTGCGQRDDGRIAVGVFVADLVVRVVAGGQAWGRALNDVRLRQIAEAIVGEALAPGWAGSEFSAVARRFRAS